MISNKFRTSTIVAAIFAALTLTMIVTASPSVAQSTVWIQVESKNNIRETKERAQFFARDFPDVSAYQTTSGWYAIVIGPMTEDRADTELRRLKSRRAIPGDSFVSDGKTYLSRLWPIGAGTQTSTGSIEITEADGQTTSQEGGDSDDVVVEDDGPIQDPDLRATKKLERTWSRDEKKLYQKYMVWTGDYDSKIDGSYGRGTRSAIRSFQATEGFEDTGYLTQDQLALLQERFDDIVSFLGIAELRDLDAGVQIQHPSNLVKFDRFEPPFVHYKSKNGSDVQMMLISQDGGRAMLKSLYDIMETFDYIPAEGYRVRKRDWFVLSGRNNDIVSYTYVRTDKKSVKGFTLIWPPERDAEMQPLATAMYNSFKPLPEYVLDETLGYGDGEDQPTNLAEGLDTPDPDRSASGFFINAGGVVLTHTSNVQSCKKITINEGTVELEVLAKNAKLKLAVLRPTGTYVPQSYALFSNEAPEVGADISVSGFSFPEVMEIATLNYGTLTDTKGYAGNAQNIRVSAFLENADAGGPVLDDRGAVIGMQLRKSNDNVLPEYANFALKSERILKLLNRHEVVYGTSTAFEALHDVDMAFMAGDFTVKVSCWE